MRAYNYTCQGESHKAENKPCQDASIARTIDVKGMTICIVSDGHGGEQYFRSQIGSQALVDITYDKVQEFAEGMKSLGLLQGTPFTQVPITAEKMGFDGSLKSIDTRFMQLFRAIKAEWMIRIYDDAMNSELNEWELAHVKTAYQEQFKEKRSLEKIYGATLMVYVRTPEFWFAFHLGDGKLIMFDDNGRGLEPVLWDKDCFLNRTTSICQEDATDRFRYTYQGDGSFPLAVFLGSDGIDDTFTDGAPLYDFYRGLMQELSANGDNAVEEYLQNELPSLSARGSKDDMSVAYCYDEELLRDSVIEITREQVENLESEFKELYQKSLSDIEKVNKIEEDSGSDLEAGETVYRTNIDYDSQISDLTKEVKDLEERKKEIEAEMERKIQAIRDEYKERLSELDESIQDKGTALTETNNNKAKNNSPENKARMKLYIDLTYAKSDIEKTEQALDALVTKINRLQNFLNTEETTREELVAILFPEEEAENADAELQEEAVSDNRSSVEESGSNTDYAADGASISEASSEQEEDSVTAKQSDAQADSAEGQDAPEEVSPVEENRQDTDTEKVTATDTKIED